VCPTNIQNHCDIYIRWSFFFLYVILQKTTCKANIFCMYSYKETHNLFIAAISNDVFFLSLRAVLELWGWRKYANVVHYVSELLVSSITLTDCSNTQEISLLFQCVLCIALFHQDTQKGRIFLEDADTSTMPPNTLAAFLSELLICELPLEKF